MIFQEYGGVQGCTMISCRLEATTSRLEARVLLINLSRTVRTADAMVAWGWACPFAARQGV